MKSNYARKLNKANIIFGIHAAFKLVIILILFVVLYTSIWIEEKYLTYVKASVYVQIFVFLTLSIVMLVVNNPHSMDICSTFINYFYLIISILELGIIVIEIYSMIKNLNRFLIRFHECPYCRTYEDITDLEYKRTCLYYNIDNNNELPYKYICYYNSEKEYYNSFCDGLICKKNNNKNEINSLVKCYKNVEKNEIKFPIDNEYHLKEFELIYKYKSSNLYSCFRKDKIEDNNNIFNNKCPDSNPVQKMLIFIYSNLIIHLLIDFLFIYEFILNRKLKEIYSNLVLLKNANQNNILSHEDEANIQNYFNNSNTNNKQTYNTEDINPSLYPSYQIKRDNSQSIIIVPGYKNSEIEEFKCNYNGQENNITCINKSFENKVNQYDNIIVHYNQNEEENNNNVKIENEGVINRKSNFKRNSNDENYKDIIDVYRRNSRQKMITVEVNKEEEYGINRINFFIRKKKRKKVAKNNNNNINKNNIDNNFNNDKKLINNNNKNINNMNFIEENKIQIFNNINVVINNKSRNQNLKISKSASKDYNSINPLVQEHKNQNNINSKNNKIINLSKNNSYFQESNNKLINIELFKNNLNIDDIKNKNNNNTFKKNNNKKNRNKYKIYQINENEEHKNNLDNSGKYNKKQTNNINNNLFNKENKCNNFENNNDIINHNDILLDDINIKGENMINADELDYKEQNIIKINRMDN